MAVRWVRCMGCGAPLGFVLEPIERQGQLLERGAVLHAKPIEQLNVPGGCPMYRAQTAEVLHYLHAGLPEIEGPKLEGPAWH